MLELATDIDRIHVPGVHQFALLVRGNPDLRRNHGHGLSIDPLMPEFAVPERPWNPGPIAFIFNKRIPYRPKKIVKGAHSYRKRGDIEQWVIANLLTNSEFALGETTAFRWMVEMGIATFRAQA